MSDGWQAMSQRAKVGFGSLANEGGLGESASLTRKANASYGWGETLRLRQPETFAP
jgi:hypothetical protein